MRIGSYRLPGKWNTVSFSVRQIFVVREKNASEKQRSLKTNFFEHSLPSLPVPSLDHTLSSFTEAVTTVLTPSQLEKTRSELTAFRRRQGAHLHDEIVRTAKVNRHTSYIAADRLDNVLRSRTPLDLNAGCPFWEAPIAAETLEEMLCHATSWTRGFAAWYLALRNNELVPPVLDWQGYRFPLSDWLVQSIALAPSNLRCQAFHLLSWGSAKPVDVKAYKQMFNALRAPGGGCDSFQHYGYENHIIVNYRGYLFVVDVADANGNPLPPPMIYSSLRDIVEMKQKPAPFDVSNLTCLDREKWFQVRMDMKRNPQNEHSLKLVESAMFVLRLHDRTPCMTDTPLFRHWVDKSLTVDIFFDKVEVRGLSGLTNEYGLQHLAEDTALFCANQKPSDAIHGRLFNPVKQLSWYLSNTQKALLSSECGKHQIITESTQLTIHSKKYTDERKEGILEGILHLATLMAWWSITHEPAMVAEIVNLHHFNCGSSEYVFINSKTAMEFLLLRENKNSSKEEERKKLNQVLREYTQNRRKTLSGFGFSNHMLGLKCMAERLYGRKLPLFDSLAYARSTQPTITTSVNRSYNLKPRYASPGISSIHVSWLLSSRECELISLEVSTQKSLNLFSASEFAAEISRQISALEAL